MIIQALGQRSVSVRSKGTMQQPTLSYLERTESTQQFHQGFPCCQTKTTMIHAAILFSIHHDSELPSGKFTLQCRQTPLNLMKGESSFKLVPKSIYHCSQIMLERKLIWKKKNHHLFTNSIAKCHRDVWQENSAPQRSPVRSCHLRLPGEQDLPSPVGNWLQSLPKT